MKFQNSNRWSFKTLSASVISFIGLLALGYAVVAPATGGHHKPLRMVLNFPGVKNPKLVDLKSTLLIDTDKVIGIILDGNAYAFSRKALMEPSRHIVNFMIDRKPISVTYCDLTNCVRVLTRDGRSDPIDLHVGGIDIDNQMVVLFDGIRYGQSSANIPLQDVAFEKTTLGVWKKQHPNTMVYEDREG